MTQNQTNNSQPRAVGGATGHLVLFGLVLVLLVALTGTLTLGTVYVPIRAVVSVLTGQEVENPGWRHIVLLYRLPRALTGALAGAALGVAGLEMQTLFRNPLADPFILGISSGASLGVAIAVMAVGGLAGGALLGSGGFVGDVSLVVAAATGSALVFMLVMLASRAVANNMALLILGMLFGYATGALVSVLMHFAEEGRLQSFILWTFGSFGGVTWRQMAVLGPVVLAALLAAWCLSKPLNALLLGERYAGSIGIHVGWARFLIICSASVLAGAVTAFCGPIGFIGIAVPHLCRGLFRTADHRILIPRVVLAGATVAVIADLAAQVPGSDTVLPLNAVTSLFGAPVVIAVILRRQYLTESFPG
jgi:iron complex transport system permease protein